MESKWIEAISIWLKYYDFFSLISRSNYKYTQYLFFVQFGFVSKPKSQLWYSFNSLHSLNHLTSLGFLRSRHWASDSHARTLLEEGTTTWVRERRSDTGNKIYPIMHTLSQLPQQVSRVFILWENTGNRHKMEIWELSQLRSKKYDILHTSPSRSVQAGPYFPVTSSPMHLLLNIGSQVGMQWRK